MEHIYSSSEGRSAMHQGSINDDQMNGIGMNIGDLPNISHRRAKRGECETCGIRTHKVGMIGKKKIPLTVEGMSLFGRCLVCDPVDDYQEPRRNNHAIPTRLTFNDDSDTFSVMSGITLDNGRRASIGMVEMGKEEDEGTYDNIEAFQQIPKSRPQPSVGSGKPDCSRNLNDPMDRIGSHLDVIGSPGLSQKKKTNPRRMSQSSIRDKGGERPLWKKTIEEIESKDTSGMAEVGFIPNEIDLGRCESAYPQEEKTEIEAFDEHVNSKKYSNGNCARNPNYADAKDSRMTLFRRKDPEEIEFNKRQAKGQLKQPPRDENGFSPDNRRQIATKPTKSAHLNRVSPTRSRGQIGKPVQEERVQNISHYQSSTNDGRQKMDQTLSDEIPFFIDSLRQKEGNSRIWEGVFLNLTDAIKQSDIAAKRLIVGNSGIQLIVQIMWEDMGNASVQRAAVELLLALVASSDGIPENDVLTKINGEGAVDALLICMQTQNSIEDIQRNGCGALCCLAAASKTNNEINDGTLSGAVLSVVSAMDVHRNSKAVQEWGIRALHNQCVYSFNSENNKRNLAESGAYDGIGMNVIHRAMETLNSDMVSLEWACRLYWCLTANETIVIAISSTPEALSAIAKTILDYHRVPEAASLVESAYGALSNLAKLESNHSNLRDAGLISATLASMIYYHNHEGVGVEACALLGNLAGNPENKEEILRSGGINSILGVLETYPENVTLFEEGLRALLCLCMDSEETKRLLSTGGALGIVVKALKHHKDSVGVLQTGCGLLASLSYQASTVRDIVYHGGIELLSKSMRAFARDKQVQESACQALRNISSLVESSDDIQPGTSLKSVVTAMNTFPTSSTLQANGCCTLWNICSKLKNPALVIEDLVTEDVAVKCIVKAMQDHSVSSEVQEMACGALWSVVYNSPDMKYHVVQVGGVDAIKCVFWMHPDVPTALENACGILSSMSVDPEYADTIASSEGISTVVEAMRSNNSNATLIQYGCLFLRNLVLLNPEYTAEAANALATIINGMKDNLDKIDLQREACDALWAMAAQSEDCKAKILALDGMNVVMSTLELATVKEVQESARGAFSQLTASRSENK